jgi:hypothetical protein
VNAKAAVMAIAVRAAATGLNSGPLAYRSRTRGGGDLRNTIYEVSIHHVDAEEG